MAYSINQQQITHIHHLDDIKRYDYFLRKITDWEQIWSLHSDEGWIELASEDGDVCLPLWPHPDFAQHWATDEWSDCRPKSVSLDVWLERWTAGLKSDDTMLVIFPVSEGAGIVISPEDLANDILAELENQR